MSDAILVTGATGFIGRHLVSALEAAGHTVKAHSRRHGDISSRPPDVDDVRHIFHLAARTFVPDSWSVPASFYEVNVVGTVNVLEFCRRTGASLTFLSSYVYGPPRTLPVSESHPLAAFNPYSHTKILAEETVRYYMATFGVRASVVRPFNVYGPSQRDHFLIPEIVRQLLDPAIDAITVADLRPRRDYIYVADLVSLLLKTVDAGAGGVYNAGSGESRSVQWIIDTVSELAGIRKPIRSTEQPRANEILDVVADVARASRDLEWRPSTSLHEGLARTIAWIQAELAAAR
jgi:nucleoside-diphosphate-sugar epimerase